MSETPLTIALPKGRLGDSACRLLTAAGRGCPDLSGDTRKLVLDAPDGRTRFLLVKPADVAVFVERGAADLGVVGRDVLAESEPDVYELLDLGIGACRMAVAARRGFVENPELPLRVASKYTHCAMAYYASRNRRIDIIKLHGSVELAPVIGLSDVIVDLVETGTTLRENDLEVIETVFESTARLIANKSSFSFSADEIGELQSRLAAVCGKG